MKKHISSGAVVYISENDRIKFLVMHREGSNSWHLPKGTQINNESLEETALREVEEETGLKINLGKYIGKLDSTFKKNGKLVQKETHYFLGQPIEKNLLLNNHDYEHDRIFFLDYKTALNNLERLSLYEEEATILKIAENMLD